MATGEKRYDITIEEDVPATMRDGTVLRADLYRPRGSTRFPVLLCRTPYNKQCARNADLARDLASRGYLVVVQDLRGRYSSDGEFFWLWDRKHCEAEDGYDTVEWAAALPHSTGRVGTFHISYEGWVQWELATLRPPHLVAMAPQGTVPCNLSLNHGIFETGRRLQWIYHMAVDLRHRDGITTGPRTKDEADELWKRVERGKWVWFLPLGELPADEIFYGLGDQFQKFLRNQNIEFWGFDKRHREVNVPALSITGWHDRDIRATDHFTGMRENGMTEHARENQKLLIGPWTHTTDLARQLGDMDFGPEAALDYGSVLTRWFDYWLKGIDNGMMDEPPIQLFVMGENVWRYEHEWPLERTVFTDFYIHSGGGANTPGGDGSLTLGPPGAEPPDSYVYDPRDPVMSLFSPDAKDAAHDQRPLDHRRDVLVYKTEPLEEDVEVTGPVEAKLWAASSALDTDFTAKLVDVYPDGFAVNVCKGIVRARYRESFESPSLIPPGQVCEYTIQMGATSNLFRKGHRIRFDISSSDFPRFDRNHNTGRPFYLDAESVPAWQNIYHNSRYPSRIILPTIPR